MTDSKVLSTKDYWTLCLMILSTFCYRIFILPLFAGWEESDYGNLAMVRGVYDSAFTHFDMNHMPGYYALGALTLFLTDNTEVAAKTAALVPNLIAVACAVWFSLLHLGRLWTILLWFCLSFQPEIALYSTSALREPSYTSWLVLFVFCLSRRSFWAGGLFAALAFTVRFEAPLVLALTFLLGSRTLAAKSVMKLLLPSAITILLWMLYCHVEHGTWQFWQHAATVNVETGLGQEKWGLEWGMDGVKVSLSLLTQLLPWRMGIFFWLCFWPGLVWSLRHSDLKWMSAIALGALGVWLGIAGVAQHEPGHNLYWKWMYPVVFFSFFPAVYGLKGLVTLVPTYLKPIVICLVMGQAGWGYLQESQRQIQRAETLYAPQVELAKWIEGNLSPNDTLILDNIPACYINRYPHERKLISWFDIPSENASEFAAFVLEHKVSYVLWFYEDWTQAPRVAPFLERGELWEQNGLRLQLIREEQAYGWRWFKVHHP